MCRSRTPVRLCPRGVTNSRYINNARELEQEARQAIAAAEQADAVAREANAKADTPIAYDAHDPATARAAQQQAQANATAATQANQTVGQAWASVDDIRPQAQDLRDR